MKKTTPPALLRAFFCPVSCLVCLLTAGALPAAAQAPAPEVTLTPLGDRVRVEIGGQPFTEYIYGNGASRSYCFPILAADGTPLTRNFPMRKVAGEETDHPGAAPSISPQRGRRRRFLERRRGDNGAAPANKGHTVVEGPVETSSGPVGVITCTTAGWTMTACRSAPTIGPSGFTPAPPAASSISRSPCTRRRTAAADRRRQGWHHGRAAGRMADHGPQDQGRPRRRHRRRRHREGRPGSPGLGKRADWANYHAEHGGRTYGVAIFDHPDDLRHPTWWMARDYGLFGANPFGEHDYEEPPGPAAPGDYTIPAGGSLTLRYRFYFHLGDEQAADVAGNYAEYAAGR